MCVDRFYSVNFYGMFIAKLYNRIPSIRDQNILHNIELKALCIH